MIFDNSKIPISVHEESKYSNYVTVLAYVIDKCNYNCLYCYNKMPRSNAVIDLDSLFMLCTHIHKTTKKLVKIELIGGEPTLHPRLLDFCEKVFKSKAMTCFVLTNFSQPLTYYESLLQLGATITATWHSTNDDPINKKYIDKALRISRKFVDAGQLELRIMFEADNFNNSKLVLNKLVFAGLSSCIQCGLLSVGSYDTHLYTKQQLDEYYQTICNVGGKSFYHVKYSDGTETTMQFNDMFLNHNFSFHNWICSAGKDYLYVHVDGRIYPCETYFYDMPEFCAIGSIYGINRITMKKTMCRCKFCTSCDFGIPKQKVFV